MSNTSALSTTGERKSAVKNAFTPFSRFGAPGRGLHPSDTSPGLPARLSGTLRSSSRTPRSRGRPRTRRSGRIHGWQAPGRSRRGAPATAPSGRPRRCRRPAPPRRTPGRPCPSCGRPRWQDGGPASQARNASRMSRMPLAFSTSRMSSLVPDLALQPGRDLGPVAEFPGRHQPVEGMHHDDAPRSPWRGWQRVRSPWRRPWPNDDQKCRRGHEETPGKCREKWRCPPASA